MSPIKIVLDNIIYTKEKQGGISNYWYEISSALLQDKTMEPFFVDERDAELNCCRQRLKIPEQLQLNPQQHRTPFLARLSSVDIPIPGPLIYHSSFYRPPANKKNITEVVTVHDFTHNYYSPWHKRWVHNKLKYGAIERAAGIICVSENTRNDLHKFCNVKNKEIAVIYNGVSDSYFVKSELNREEKQFLNQLNLGNTKFLLFVGSRAGYKNFGFVLDLLQELQDYKLVAVGSPFNENEIKALKIRNLLNRTINTNNIENSRLNILYNEAHCLVYPSWYEGFGIPVAEAMKAGCPVIALNRSSIPEIASGGAILMDDLNITEFKNEVKRLESEDYRNEIKARSIIQGRRFDWIDCTRKTIDFYKQVYSRVL